MAVYRPTYKDRDTGEWKESTIWWYRFTFPGKRVRESSKSAVLADYKLRNPRSATFATQTMAHVKRPLGAMLASDITDATVKEYQRDRPKEGAAPKTINDEPGMLLRILEEQGDAIRAKMRRLKTLKLKAGRTVAKVVISTSSARRGPNGTCSLSDSRNPRTPHARLRASRQFGASSSATRDSRGAGMTTGTRSSPIWRREGTHRTK